MYWIKGIIYACSKQTNKSNSQKPNKISQIFSQKHAVSRNSPVAIHADASLQHDADIDSSTSDFSLEKISINPRSGSVIQTRLKIYKPGDKSEQEAEQIADRIVNMPVRDGKPDVINPVNVSGTPGMAQRQTDEDLEEEEELQTSARSGGSRSITANVQRQILSQRGGGQVLAPSVSAFFEPRFGTDFSGTRVHVNSIASQTATALNARAFTV